MPLPIAHGILGASVVAVIHPRPLINRASPILWGAFWGISADFDFGLAWLFGNKSLHRGFSHSIGFSLFVFAAMILMNGSRKVKLASAYSLAFLLHGLLDFLTTKQGSKVQIFWPLLAERFRLGLIGLSEGSTQMSLSELMRSSALELAIFTPIFLIFWAMRSKLNS